MIHVVRAAFFRTPIANVRAQLTQLFGERTVTGNSVGAKPADRRAFDTARGAGVGARFPDHMRKAVAACGRAVIAGGDAILVALH